MWLHNKGSSAIFRANRVYSWYYKMVLENKSDIKFVIFDLDGTLVDSKFDLTDSVNFVRHEYGFNPLPIDEVSSYLGSGITALVKAVLSELKNGRAPLSSTKVISPSPIWRAKEKSGVISTPTSVVP